MAQQHIYHWKHGWIPLDHAAALSKAHGSESGATRLLNTHYHVSHPHNRASIERDGLKTQHSLDGKHIWLYQTLGQAQLHRDMATTRLMDGSVSRPDIYRVDLSGMKTAKDPHKIMTDVGNVVVRKDIPASRVKRVKDETPRRVATPSPVGKDARTMTSAQKIRAAEIMYGTGSAQHRAAQKKFGGKP